MSLQRCPSPEQLELFLLGDLVDAQWEGVETHVLRCAGCQQSLASTCPEDELVREFRRVAPLGTTEVDELADLLVPYFGSVTLEASLPDAPPVDVEATTMSLPTSGVTPHVASGGCAIPARLGDYELLDELGAGGMGRVLRAHDHVLRRDVAIKVLGALDGDHRSAAERALAEARAAAAVRHDHIVEIYAVGSGDMLPYLVMPLLKGESLRQRMRRMPGPFTIAEVLRIAEQLADGLAAAHGAGLVHRDIKPENIWLESPADRVLILDFGLSTWREEVQGARHISGTPGYMAPEQARGESTDPRADLFSLGCVLYRLATGREAFTGATRWRRLWTILGKPLHPRSLQPRLPLPLGELIERLLAPRREERPAAAAEVLTSVRSIAHGIELAQRMASRRRWLWGVAGAGALGLAGGGALLFMGLQETPVEVTLIGDDEPIAVVLRHDGRERSLSLGARQVLQLVPGDHHLRAADSAARTMVPAVLTIEAGEPCTIRVAAVGELARHATHSGPVTGVATLSGGRGPRVASVGLDRTLALWDLTGAAAVRFVTLPHVASCVASDPQGAWIATAGGNRQLPAELAIRVYSAEALVESQVPLEGHTRIVRSLAADPAGGRLASAAADGVLLWDIATGESRRLPQSPSGVTALAFSMDGRRLHGVDDDGRLMTWNVEQATAAPPRVEAASAEPLRAIAAWSRGVATAGDDRSIRIRADDQPTSRMLTGHRDKVLALAISPDGEQLLSGDAAGELRFWSLPTGRLVHSLRVQETGRNDILAVSYLADGRRAVTGGRDGRVRLWRAPFS